MDVCTVCAICIWFLFISRVRNIMYEQILYGVHVTYQEFLKIAFNLCVTNIYSSRWHVCKMYIYMGVCVCMFLVSVHCDEHLQLVHTHTHKKSHRYVRGCAIRKQWKWNGIFGQNELKWRRINFGSAQLNRIINFKILVYKIAYTVR